MFQSVVQQSGGAGRFGSGVWVSLAVHAALLGAALLVSGSTRKAPPEEDIPVVFQHARPTAPPSPPTPRPSRPAERKPVAQRVKPRPPSPEPRLTPPSPEPRPESPPEPVSEVGPEAPEGAADSPVGVAEAERGSVCADCIVGAALATREEPEDVVPFGAGMTPPRLLGESVPVRYTPEASRAQVQGLLIARCTITRQGEVQDCRIIKGLPFMEEAVLESLAGRRYQPVTFQGRPVNALYTFNVHLRMP